LVLDVVGQFFLPAPKKGVELLELLWDLLLHTTTQIDNIIKMLKHLMVD